MSALDVINLLVNLTLGLISGALNVRYWATHRQPWRWVKLAAGVVSVTWAVLYVLFLGNVFNGSLGIWHSLVNGLMTLTLLVFAVGAILTDKRRG